MPPVRRVVAALRHPATLGGAGVVALVALLGPSAPAAAAATPCVGVVVDARLAGGPVRTACATGDPKTGLDALTRAGIAYAFVPRVPGQVCQLAGRPACSDTGADTYWSYWWRAKGSSRWVYATTGAGTHDPDPGDTEAWVWQDGGRVEPPDTAFTTICPQAATTPDRTRTPTPAATHEATPTGDAEPVPDASTSHQAGSSGVRTRSPRPSAASPAPTSSSAASPAPAPTTSSASSSAEPSTAAAAGGPTAAAGSDRDTGGSSPPWAGLAVGAVLVGGLGGAAAVRARRAAS